MSDDLEDIARHFKTVVPRLRPLPPDIVIAGIRLQYGITPEDNIRCVICGEIILYKGVRYTRLSIMHCISVYFPNNDSPVCVESTKNCRAIFDAAPII